MKMDLQFFGGGGSKSGLKGGGGSGGKAYEKRDTPKRITLNNGDMTFTAESYGEGWKNGYHVRQTDRVGGEFIDKGSIDGFKIGEKVKVKETTWIGTKEVDGEIVMAHKYPNGKVEFNVEVSDGWRTNTRNYDSSSLIKKRKRKS